MSPGRAARVLRGRDVGERGRVLRRVPRRFRGRFRAGRFAVPRTGRDCRDAVGADEFRECMGRVLPLLADGSVIVMDNAPYHTAKVDRAPTMDDGKDVIVEWLKRNGETADRSMVYVELMAMVRRVKPLRKKYAIDELAKADGKTVLRLPRNHRELNPMVLAWSSVKEHVSANVSSCEPSDGKNLIVEAVDRVNAEMWKGFVGSAMEEEKKMLRSGLHRGRPLGRGLGR
ncbi:uncharacterized protein LOC112693894 [Sipha flava]|uniref:Uncharacterized protein LOC112693894 n=1 Tax=Sipha flava TaxID=143950 RepID=A0A8B8GPE2_9HEMI|nr:uncharacterized protein LOC112693894 [Sipha flava]